VISVEVWIYPQCMASAVSGPLDIFAAANAIWLSQNQRTSTNAEPLFRWSLRSLDGQAVRTPAGMLLQPDGPIEASSKPDLVLLPGIFLDQGLPGLWQSLADLQPLYPLLRARHAAGAVLGANCSASFLLAEARLLDGGHATTTWWLERAFRARYPQVDLQISEVLTEYDDILCTGAGTTYLNLTQYLLQRYAGQELAAACAKAMLIDANRSSQTAYMSLTQQESQAHDNALVHKAQKWIAKLRSQAFSLQALAGHLAVSERTVIRHFHQALGTTPAAYAQAMKLEHAKRLLETSTLSLETVAEKIGYADPGSFRRLFKRETGLSPADYRQQFRQRRGSKVAAA
jgi:transcriptional regulator GlxA family with amidase domain